MWKIPEHINVKVLISQEIEGGKFVREVKYVEESEEHCGHHLCDR